MVRRVRWTWLLISVVFCGDPVCGEEATSAGSRFSGGKGEVKSAETVMFWLEGFAEIDTERVNEVVGRIQQQVRGEYEVDLGMAKGTARFFSTLLSGTEETRGYAAWLEARYPAWPDRWSFRIGDREKEPLEPRGLDVSREHGDEDPKFMETRGAEHFVPRLKPIFESLQVPVELVWVAEVESSFNPRAVSRVGAAGLYQLMPATARQYGLELEPEDDRFVPEKNARAAARHMLYLKRVFDDWHLAMAAYNAGHNRVRRLLAKHNARSFEEISTYLPLETQLFVPKVDATLVKREGVSLARLGSSVP
jgi:membrane-bound lytic murein transglycosylase D